MPDRKDILILRCQNAIDRGEPIMDYSFYYEVGAILKKQAERIKQLEHDLAVAQNNLNYYVNGND